MFGQSSVEVRQRTSSPSGSHFSSIKSVRYKACNAIICNERMMSYLGVFGGSRIPEAAGILLGLAVIEISIP